MCFCVLIRNGYWNMMKVFSALIKIIILFLRPINIKTLIFNPLILVVKHHSCVTRYFLHNSFGGKRQVNTGIVFIKIIPQRINYILCLTNKIYKLAFICKSYWTFWIKYQINFHLYLTDMDHKAFFTLLRS